MKYAKLSDSGDIYNKAFEVYRREFLKEHFTAIAAGLVLLTAGLIACGRIRKKRRARKAAEKISEKEEKQT